MTTPALAPEVRERAVIAELVTALEMAAGALAATAPEGSTIIFTKDWARLGSPTVGEVLDRADQALISASEVGVVPSLDTPPADTGEAGR